MATRIKPAIVVSRSDSSCPNGGSIQELRAGRNGAGRVIHTCRVWPNERSEDMAGAIFAEVATREGYEILAPLGNGRFGCPDCQGEGEIPPPWCEACQGYGEGDSGAPCSECDGESAGEWSQCARCGGAGDIL